MEQDNNNKSRNQNEQTNSYMPPVEPGEKYQPNADKKGMVKSIILVLVGLLLIFVGAAGTWTYQHNQIEKKQKQISELQNDVQELQKKSEAETVELADEISDWKDYSDKSQAYSLKYPPTWVTLTECDGTSVGFHTAPTSESLSVCGSDKASLVVVSSVEGNKTVDYLTSDPNFQTDFKKEDTTLNGIKGAKVTYTDNGQGLRSKGTKNVIYVFFTNNRTYVASYTQEQNYPNELSTFTTMVTKTLKFSAN